VEKLPSESVDELVARPITGREYRERKRNREKEKDFALSDGTIIRIRKPDRYTLTSLMSIMEVPVDPEKDNVNLEDASIEMTPEMTAKIMDVVLEKCIVAPKIVLSETDKDDELWLGDLDPLDGMELMMEILQWSGLTKDRLKGAFFRRGRTVS